MQRTAATDPIEAVNAYAAGQGWPFRGSAQLEFDQPELNQLRDIWHRKAAGTPIPYRSEFDVRTLKPVLRNVSILECVHEAGRRRYRIRLMGSEVVQMLGEGTGRYVDETVPARALPHWHAVYDSVMEALVPLRFLTRYKAKRMDYLVSESFNAPMLNARGEPKLMICCAYFQSRISHAEIFG